MRSVWQSLAWKEWHEHKWKLAALSGVLCGVTAASLLVLLREQRFSLDGFLPALVMGMIPLTMSIAAGESAGENAGRTMPFLQSLPVPMWKAAVWKLVFGALSCLVPVLLALLIVSAWYFGAEMWGKNPKTELWIREGNLLNPFGIDQPLLAWNIAVLMLVGTSSLSLLVWAAALGVNRKSELAAGASALLGIVSVWVVVFLIMYWIETRPMGRTQFAIWTSLVLAITPSGLPLLITEYRFQLGSFYWMAIPVAFVVHIAITSWYALRLGRPSDYSYFSPRETSPRSAQSAWLGLPRRSPLTAVVWKQFRESGPLALAGLAAILFFFCLTILANSEWYFSRQGQMEELLASLTLQFGFLVVLIVGIGVFDRDLSPKLNTFWRSRPIDPNLWYWTKYFTGLLVLAVALGAPLLISGTWYVLSTGWWSWLSTDRSPHLLMLVMAISILVAVYALAVAMICLVRVSIYAAILSMSVLAGSVGLVWLFLDSNNSDWTTSNWAAVGLAMASIVALLATLVGWWAVRRDVGWKK